MVSKIFLLTVKRNSLFPSYQIKLTTAHASFTSEGSSKEPQNKQNTFIYIRSESDDNRGSNQIVSALHHRITNTPLEDIQKIDIQNKNLILIGMLCKTLVKDLPHVKKIHIFFPVTGLYFLPADRIFGRLESKFR